MGLQGLCHCQVAVCGIGGGHHQGVLEEDGRCGGRSSGGKKQKRKEDEEIEAEFGLMVEELWRRSGRSRSGGRSRGGPL